MSGHGGAASQVGNFFGVKAKVFLYKIVRGNQIKIPLTAKFDFFTNYMSANLIGYFVSDNNYQIFSAPNYPIYYASNYPIIDSSDYRIICVYNIR